MARLTIIFLLSSCVSASAADAENGKTLFMADGCYSCHGTVGQGSGDVGPRLAPDGPDLAAVKQELRHPAARMPAYSESVVSDAQAEDIAAYLHSIVKGKPAADIALLSH